MVARLQAGGRALDVGCGTGVVPITLAKAFPAATVAGLDFDARSIEIVRGHARNAGLSDRIAFLVESVNALPANPGWDFISTFDVVHDLPDPLCALKRIRSALTRAMAHDAGFMRFERLNIRSPAMAFFALGSFRVSAARSVGTSRAAPRRPSRS